MIDPYQFEEAWRRKGEAGLLGTSVLNLFAEDPEQLWLVRELCDLYLRMNYPLLRPEMEQLAARIDSMLGLETDRSQ